LSKPCVWKGGKRGEGGKNGIERFFLDPKKKGGRRGKGDAGAAGDWLMSFIPFTAGGKRKERKRKIEEGRIRRHHSLAEERGEVRGNVVFFIFF